MIITCWWRCLKEHLLQPITHFHLFSLVGVFVAVFMLRLNFYIATIGEQLVELAPKSQGMGGGEFLW